MLQGAELTSDDCLTIERHSIRGIQFANDKVSSWMHAWETNQHRTYMLGEGG